MESCGRSLVKCLLFIFNVVFAVCGLIILTAGAIVLASMKDYNYFTKNKAFVSPAVLIVAGVIIFIIALLGCWGEFRENYKVLLVYAVLLLIICIIVFAVGVAAVAVRNDLQRVLNNTMHESMQHYSNEDSHKYVWDKVQKNLNCCGTTSPNEWKIYLDSENGVVPNSCCKVPETLPCDNSTVNNSIWRDGCYDKLKNEVKSGALLLGGIALGIAFIELAGFILAVILAYSIKTNAEDK